MSQIAPQQHRQAVAPPGRPGRSRASGQQAPAAPQKKGRLRASLSKTPGKFQLLGAVAIVASLAFGVFGFVSSNMQASSLTAANANTTQLQGVQNARNSLVSADAAETNAFLVGGLEPRNLRTAYENGIKSASTALVSLAGTKPADAANLAKVNSNLSVYTGLIEQARANNRQGYPVGSAYLDDASTQLRSQMLPVLDTTVESDADRAATDFNTVGGSPWLLILCLACIAVLVVCQVWLAKRTHRVFNPGLLGATIVTILVGVVAVIGQVSAAGTSKSVRDGSYAATLAVSQAYSEANDAKSMESFTLIKRGSGQAYEDAFNSATANASKRLTDAEADGVLNNSTLEDQLQAWISAHKEIRKLDDAGNWDGAVAKATSSGKGSSNALFDTFSKSAQEQASSYAAETDKDLSSAARMISIVSWLMIVAGVAAAILAWRGIMVRLREYR